MHASPYVDECMYSPSESVSLQWYRNSPVPRGRDGLQNEPLSRLNLHKSVPPASKQRSTLHQTLICRWVASGSRWEVHPAATSNPITKSPSLKRKRTPSLHPPPLLLRLLHLPQPLLSITAKYKAKLASLHYTKCHSGKTSFAGYCPNHDASTLCCVPDYTSFGTCYSGGTSGTCVDTGYCSRSGRYSIAGLCPGPGNVRCCLRRSGNFQ